MLGKEKDLETITKDEPLQRCLNHLGEKEKKLWRMFGDAMLFALEESRKDCDCKQEQPKREAHD